MSGSLHRPSLARWSGRLNGFILEKQAEVQLPSAREMSGLIRRQHEISSYCLQRFIDFVKELSQVERLSSVEDRLLGERLLVILTDTPGGLAASQMIKQQRLYAIWLTSRLWGHWQADKVNRDPELHYHYRYWSYWDQKVNPRWAVPEDHGGELWVHTEGHLMARLTGRWARHLWHFDQKELTLVSEAIEHGTPI